MDARPVLIYDGDCGFCRRWVERWRGVTGDAVEYATSEDAAPALHPTPAEPAVAVVDQDRARVHVQCLSSASPISNAISSTTTTSSVSPRRASDSAFSMSYVPRTIATFRSMPLRHTRSRNSSSACA